MDAKMQDWLSFLGKAKELGASHVRIDGENSIEVTFGNQVGVQVVPQTTISTDESVLSALIQGGDTAKELLEDGKITPRQKLELEMALEDQHNHDHYRSA